ncbi:MAG TPA: alkyl sulfatase dimerization domain-containing protein [Pseudomonadales bacterium]|nr:alkyl sulfatase dimerization domain-containing protein [Pseudomonadales bacterium]
MADLLGMASKIIDGASDAPVGPVNRITHELSELVPGVAMVEAFSHSVLFDTDDGLVVFDTSGAQGGKRVVDAIRGWSKKRFNTLVYTHGHVDHVGGCGAFLADAENANAPRPTIAGHENVPRRFDRYDLTNGYNLTINARQFRGLSGRGYGIGGPSGRFLPPDSAKPNVTYSDRLALDVGGLQFDLRHAKGETDDHTWAWIERYKAICAGDFFIWNFPNAGNPQKVQRYPVEWAAAMRAMAGVGAELFLPAHGLPIAGKERIKRVLLDVAGTLEKLVGDTLAMMNDGAPLNDIIHTVKVAPDMLARPYLRPLYDEPEFVVRNVWRMYGGWYDGNPANLKPARDKDLAAELTHLAGGADTLAQRAQRLAADGDLRLACHLIEIAARGEPRPGIFAIRAQIYQQRRDAETSLMAKGIYGAAAGESLAAAGVPDPHRS